MTTSPRAPAPPPGLTVGGYALRARLGEGGMGVVHLGQRPGERPVAIKVLRPHIVGDEEARRRLEREVGSLTRVRSRRVAEIVDADPWGDIPFVATRYVPGLSLHDHVREEGPLVGPDLIWFADCLAEALDAVHSVGVLHRDIKPSNVIMEGRTPILIDFGLARVADDPRLTMTGWLLGTPGYLAPEILHGEDARTASDVHSWAATVAFAGLGRAPFGGGPSMAVMDRVRRGEHDLRGLDRDLAAILEEALDPDPGRRPTLRELRHWLDELAEEQGGTPPGGARGPRAVPTAALPVTAPVAAAAFEEASATTREVDGRHHGADDAWSEPTVVDRQDWDQWQSTDPVQARPGGAERARRALLTAAIGAVVVGGVVAAPYLTVLVVGVLTWLLRSGSMAAGAAGDRRRLRGARWWDGPRLLLSTPWHVVRALAGSLVLVLWSLGLVLAAALLCFAVSLSVTTSLAVLGATFAAALWWGPGSGRLRSPVRRVVAPLARGAVPWVLVTILVLAGASALGAVASAQGTVWTPDDSAPFSDVQLPGWL